MRVIDLKIGDIAFGGKGVGREQGKAVFVPYTIEGELVSAEILREKKQFAEAGLVEVKESSPHRVTPECPYFGRCGGCATFFSESASSKISLCDRSSRHRSSTNIAIASQFMWRMG